MEGSRGGAEVELGVVSIQLEVAEDLSNRNIVPWSWLQCRKRFDDLTRYLDTHPIARRKWIDGNELKITPEKNSTGPTSIPATAFKVKGNTNSSEQKINEGENPNCLEVQDKTESVSCPTAVNKSSSQNTLEHSSLCTVL